jgi:hypothetical protein
MKQSPPGPMFWGVSLASPGRVDDRLVKAPAAAVVGDGWRPVS